MQRNDWRNIAELVDQLWEQADEQSDVEIVSASNLSATITVKPSLFRRVCEVEPKREVQNGRLWESFKVNGIEVQTHSKLKADDAVLEQTS